MSGRIDPAEYVLGLLTPEQEAEARRLEHEDPAFAAELRALHAAGRRLDALEADEWDAAGPPPLRLEDIAPRPERPSLRERVTRPLRGRSFGVRPAVALACSLLLVGLGVFAGTRLAGDEDGGAAPGGAVVALDRFGDGPAGAGGQATVASIDGTPEVRIDAHGLQKSAPGTRYEVWMIRDARRMVSLGTFTVGRNGRAVVTLPVTADPRRYPIMDVSIEPADGDAAHSGHSVLRSPATPA
jgi:anti-sigma-K factor RskA